MTRSNTWHLIDKHKLLSAEDFRRIGKWKDDATTENQWKPNVASVAYLIWEQAAEELPKCPDENGIAVFPRGLVQQKIHGRVQERFEGETIWAVPRNYIASFHQRSALPHLRLAGKNSTSSTARPDRNYRTLSGRIWTHISLSSKNSPIAAKRTIFAC